MLSLYLNFPLSGNAAARICQQQVRLLSSQSSGRGVSSERASGPSLSSAASRQFILGQGEPSRAEPKLSVSHPVPVVGTLSPRLTGFCAAKRKDDAFRQNNAVANGGCLGGTGKSSGGGVPIYHKRRHYRATDFSDNAMFTKNRILNISLGCSDTH